LVGALAARPPRLFKVELKRPRSVIGKTTNEALQSGLLYGFAGQVDGMVRRISRELDTDPVVIATGGLSHLMASVCETLTHHEPDLTLHGLRLVYDRNA
jgi:type III pantothenate kinase